MNGPEHYRKGEELLARAEGNYESVDDVSEVTLIAQGHFLAAIAATLGTAGRFQPLPTHAEWLRVAGQPTPEQENPTP